MNPCLRELSKYLLPKLKARTAKIISANSRTPIRLAVPAPFTYEQPYNKFLTWKIDFLYNYRTSGRENPIQQNINDII